MGALLTPVTTNTKREPPEAYSLDIIPTTAGTSGGVPILNTVTTNTKWEPPERQTLENILKEHKKPVPSVVINSVTTNTNGYPLPRLFNGRTSARNAL